MFLNVRPVIQAQVQWSMVYGLYKGHVLLSVLVWIFSKSQKDQKFFSNTWLCIKSGPTLLFAFALSLTLRAQKWAVVSRLDFLFSFLNSHRGEKLWQLHLIPRPRLTKYQILTKLYFIHVDCSVVHCAFQNSWPFH